MPSDDWAASVVAHATASEPTLGSGRLICVDGLTGAGKTTLAAAVAAITGATVIHTDDLLEGWAGLPGLGTTIDALLRPLPRGGSSSWRRWDWHASAWAQTHPISPTPWLVLDGVGSGAAAYDELITTLVWIEADRDLRLERAVARDGEPMRADLERWLDDEAALHERERTRERANLVYSSSA